MTHAPPTPFFFFFNDTATTEIYTLSLHDALPICRPEATQRSPFRTRAIGQEQNARIRDRSREYRRSIPCRCVRKDRKSTRLNSSHSQISYAVFCLKKKNDRQAIIWSLFATNRSAV